MIKLKKLGLTAIGTLAIATPIATVVSCGEVTKTTIGSFHKEPEPKEQPSEVVDTSLKNIAVDKYYREFSSAFKLSSTNTTDNDLIKNGKIASSTDIQSGKANFSKKILLNITLSDELQNDLKQEYEKAKKDDPNDNGYALKLKIRLPFVVEGKFFQNDINSESEAETISQQIQDLEKHDKTKVGFNLELPTWLNTMKDIDITIRNDDYKTYATPNFTNTRIQGVKSNGNNITGLSLLGLGLYTFDQSKFPSSLKTLNLQTNHFTSFDVSHLSALTHLELNDNHTKASWKDASSVAYSTLSLDDVLLPLKLKELIFTGNWIKTMDATRLPVGLTTLNIGDNKMKKINTAQLPSSLKKFILEGNEIWSFDATTLPAGLTDLNLSLNKLRSFDSTQLPKGLISLKLERNKLQVGTFDATQLPSTLKELNLRQNELMNFDATQLPSGLEKLFVGSNALSKFNYLALPKSLKEFGWGNNWFDAALDNEILAWWQVQEARIYNEEQERLRREERAKWNT